MTIQAVFFDMGGTIETFNYSRESRLKAVPGLRTRLAATGIDLPLTDEQLLDLVSRGMKKYHQWRLQSLEELPAWRIWQEYILADHSVPLTVLRANAEDFMTYYERFFYNRQMRSEIPAVLVAIQKMGLKIGLISNVCSRGQVPVNLEQYGIRHYFYPLVLSSEYGRRKPDPAIFHHAARLANVPTSQCAYVGDRISRDILGAYKAGFRLAVQIRHDYDHGEADDGAVPDAVIGQMTELLDILHTELSRPVAAQPGNIRALLFDAGDVLYHRPQRGQPFKEYLDALGLDSTDPHTAEKNNLAHQAFQGLITQDEYREALVCLHGVTGAEQIARGIQVLAGEDEDVHFFPGVAETLADLKQMGYLLGIVTDTANSLSTKLRWFESGGFGRIWDSIISSKEIGARKPDPRLYRAALQQLGVSAKQAIFVGHKISELDGAHAVGLKTVAFNYDKSAQADHYIENFSDLLALPFIVRTVKQQVLV